MQAILHSLARTFTRQKHRTRLLPILLALVLLIALTSMAAFSQAATPSATPLDRTPWQIHRGLDRNNDGIGNDVITIVLTGSDDAKGFAEMDIPAFGDVGWNTVVGPVFIAEDTQDALKKLGCARGVDFTYFQTLVSVPKDAALTDFEVTFKRVDDLARIYIFNSKSPEGTFVGGNLRGNTVVTTNLKDSVALGEANRVVVVQFDSCPGKNNIQDIQIKVNGNVATEVPASAISLPTALVKTGINVCSQYDSSNPNNNRWNIHGDNAASLREKLTNPANFGPVGTYGNYLFSFKTVTDTVTSELLVEAKCDIWFSGYEEDSAYTSDEGNELKNWVTNNNGQVIAGCDDSTHDPVCDLLGYTVATGTDTHGVLSNRAVNPINCDASLLSGDKINMSGGAGGYFVGPEVRDANVLADHESAPYGPVIIYTGNYFLTSDINMIEKGKEGDPTLSDGPTVTNINDIMAMNAFSALSDASVGKEVCSSAVAEIKGRIYVDHDATGAATGLSWTDAFTNVQDGLAKAVSGDQVWVAEGVYYPDVGGTATNNDHLVSFAIKSGILLYGGFEGTELSLNQRDWKQHRTILSGDIEQDDERTDDIVTDARNIHSTNSIHVVSLNGTSTPITSTTRIDGFIITAGRAVGEGANVEQGIGGGLLCNGFGAGSVCSPTVSNVSFIGNMTSVNGGAMFNDGRNSGDSSPTLTNVIFSGNSAKYGGALYNYGGSGGKSSPTLTNVLFLGNSAEVWGGAILNQGENKGASSPTLTNVTISGNRAGNSGSALYNFGTNGASNPTLTNVILWQNGTASIPSIYNLNAAYVTIQHSVVENGLGSITGTLPITTNVYANNNETDPLFVQAVDPSSAPTSAGDLRLRTGSSAINRGLSSALPVDVTTDLTGYARISDTDVDAGAYEFHPSTVLGQVVDATKKANSHLAGAHVCIRNSQQCATTNGDGQYILSNVTAIEQVLEVTASGYITVEESISPAPGETITRNFALSPDLAVGEIRIVLEWGENPRDLDSHLWVPSDGTNSQYNVYFPVSNQGEDTTFPWAKLDVDDTTSYGPETITIKKRITGTYIYAVHHYDGDGSLFSSEARVRVYGPTGLIGEYTPPTNQDGVLTWWHVFTLDGTSGVPTEIGTLNDVSPGPSN